MNLLTRLFNKPKEPITIKKNICKKHGAVPDWSIRCDDKVYPACWHCVGEFASKYVTEETIEIRKAQEK
jgi:hypothetical protein